MSTKTKFLRLLSFAGLLIASPSVWASPELSLLPKCEALVRDAVLRKAVALSEDAQITGVQLIYGGSRGGLHYDSAIVVRVSDETEPSDYMVLTTWVSSEYADAYGCKLTAVKLMNTGSLPDVPGLE